MNRKNMTTTFAALFIGLMLSCTAWAEKPTKHQTEKLGSSCKIEGGNSHDTSEGKLHQGYIANDFFTFGDLKLRVESESSGIVDSNYYVTFDLKASNYVKRGVQLKIGQKFVDTICGTEVTITTTGTQFRVSTF